MIRLIDPKKMKRRPLPYDRKPFFRIDIEKGRMQGNRAMRLLLGFSEGVIKNSLAFGNGEDGDFYVCISNHSDKAFKVGNCNNGNSIWVNHPALIDQLKDHYYPEAPTKGALYLYISSKGFVLNKYNKKMYQLRKK